MKTERTPPTWGFQTTRCDAMRRDAGPERENCITPGALLCLNARYAETLKVVSHKVVGESDILLVTAPNNITRDVFRKRTRTKELIGGVLIRFRGSIESYVCMYRGDRIDDFVRLDARPPARPRLINAPLLARVSARFNVNASTSSSKISNISIGDTRTRNGASPVSALRA